MNKSISVHVDHDRAADDWIGFISDPGRQAGPWPRQFQDSQAPYILKSLLRQSHLLEAVRNRLLLEWATCKSSAEAHRLLRQARSVAKELLPVWNAIYRVQKDMQDGYPALIVPADLALADAAPHPEASALERVMSSDAADEVFEAEFAGLVNKAQQAARPELLWAEDTKVVPLPTLSKEDAEAGVSPTLAAFIGLDKAREAIGK